MARHSNLQTIKRTLYSLFYLIFYLGQHFDVHDFVQGYDCFRQRFPLAIGFDSGNTDIKFIDQDPTTGYLYMVGITTATELKVSGAQKSVFIAQHTCS